MQNCNNDVVELYLSDRVFSHQEFTVPEKSSEKIKWNRGAITNPDIPIVYSHYDMLWIDKQKKNKKIGLVFESQAIFPYSHIEHIIPEYDVVFTHSSELLAKYKNTRWIPGGGIWIGGKVDEKMLGGSYGDIEIYPKTKDISIVSSDKRMCELHILRKQVASLLSDDVDVYGTFGGKWIPIIESLKDYRFSIAIENFVDEKYFTEKLLNCFATGTIPIYLGARDLRDFDRDGIIQCKNERDIYYEVFRILQDPQYHYESMQEAIANNFETCKKYSMIEDYIYDNYREEII
jgi:hypothetical protein